MRFGFHCNWNMHKLKEFTHRITTKNKRNESNLILTISAENGLVNQEKFFNRKVASDNLSGYYLLKKGDFAYNKSYSNNYPWGAIKRLDNYDKGVVSALYICFSSNDDIDSDYLKHYFESNKWNHEVSDIAVEGARNHGLLNISINDFFNTNHYLPGLTEQKKIACFLNLIEARLDTQKKIIGDLNSLKKRIRNIIFSHEHKEYAPLKSYYIKGKAGGTPKTTKREYYKGNIPFLSISDISNNGKYIYKCNKNISKDGLNNSAAWIVPTGSLILSMYASVGYPCINKIELTTSQAMFSMILKKI